MRQLQDEDLILYYYGEAENPEEVREALASSPELAGRFESLLQTLDTATEALPVPARPDSYGAEVWARLQARLDDNGLRGFPPPGTPHPWPLSLPSTRPARERGTRRPGIVRALIAAVLLLAVGFLAGRFWPRPGQGPQIAKDIPLSPAARERILVRTVANHLERSERLLTELANTETAGSVDVSAERQWAQDLLAANRLYRQSARQGGRPQLAFLLDELEPFLLELAHGPSEIPADELEDLRARVEDQALLFKMRVVSQRLERKNPAVAAGRQTL